MLPLRVSGPESNGNEEVLYILQISKAGDLPSDGLSLSKTPVGRMLYTFAEMQSVYFIAPADWALFVFDQRTWYITVNEYL